jgi:hypothetical protein
MNVYALPAVQAAAEAIRSALVRVRLEHPELTPLQQVQAAKARCVDAIVAANTAVSRAERLADDMANGRIGTAYNQALKASAAARREKVREYAAMNPGMTTRELARHLQISQSAVVVALHSG